MQRLDFQTFPEGYTFNGYMNAYLEEMVSHEMGHNFGLRHNFKGNLGATDDGTEGSVSRSIMEYLGKSFRHLNRVGEYDRMALRYSYLGERPAYSNWFCTDEDVASTKNADKSAECLRDDATSDPFGYALSLLSKAATKLVGEDSGAPIWKAADMERELNLAATILAVYAKTAEETSDQWENFFMISARPTNRYELKPFVLEQIREQFLGREIQQRLDKKSGFVTRIAAKNNLKDGIKLIEPILGDAFEAFEVTYLSDEL
jgi:hypothetical protein